MITDTTYQEHDVFEALKGKVVVTEAGTYQHYNADGQLHREAGPAVEWRNGAGAWYQCGLLHRENGPAIRTPDGSLHWFIHNQKHREDGPAIIYADGTEIWYRYGLWRRA